MRRSSPVSGHRPISNLVSARMRPLDATDYAQSEKSAMHIASIFFHSPLETHPLLTTSSPEHGTSPTSLLVVGVRMGSGSCAFAPNPSGNSCPQKRLSPL